MRTSSRIFGALPVLVFVLTGAQNLFANSTTVDPSFSGTGISASGTFTASLVSGNEYRVTSIYGMQNTFSMTFLGYAGNDDGVFSSNPFLDASGLGFVLSIENTDCTIYYDSGRGTYFERKSGAACNVGSCTTVESSLTQVPEPATLMLLGSGLVGLAGMARRKLLG